MAHRSAEEIINDTEKGSAELMQDAAGSILQMEVNKGKEFMEKVVKNRYSMSPLINLANVFFLSIENGKDSSRVVKNYMEDIRESKNDTIKKMKSIIKKNDYEHISTFSYSSTVISSINDVGKMTVFESRPLNEGRKTAKSLKSNGIDVEYWVDAAILKGLEGCDAVIIGADTISNNVFLNKIGSYPLVLSAKEKEIPTYIVSDDSKLLPEDLKMSKGESHPSNEVWYTVKEINVHNEYFERVPLKYVSSVIGESVFSKDDIRNKVKRKEVSELLKDIYPLR